MLYALNLFNLILGKEDQYYWDMRAWVRESQPGNASQRAGNAIRETPPHLVLLPGLLCDAVLWRPQLDELAPLCEP